LLLANFFTHAFFISLDTLCLSFNDKSDDLKGLVPPGYPRQLGTTKDVNHYKDPIAIISIAFGALSTVIMLLIFGGTFYFREHKVMKTAQISFLYLFCLGYLLVSLGAIMHGMLPSDGTCIAKEWLVLFGYTLVLAPLAVKVTAISRLLRHARMMRRHTISQRELFVSISLLVVIALIYLTIWTVLDPPTMVVDIVLRDNTDDVVDAHVLCSSTHTFWGGGALGWEGILIFYSFVLAWQARRIIKQKKIAELQMVCNMAYASFMVFVFRSVVFYLPSVAIVPHTRAGAESILLSFDTMLSVLVYFGPKFVLIQSKAETRDSCTSTFEQEPMSTECPQCGWNFHQSMPAYSQVGVEVIPRAKAYATTSRRSDFDPLTSDAGTDLNAGNLDATTSSPQEGHCVKLSSICESAQAEKGRELAQTDARPRPKAITQTGEIACVTTGNVGGVQTITV
jgi:hypothetical protein